ncbi:Uncharacterised protein [Halioglobus japonicus]|nr:Uncharacterised protein [Halioglobus japonicus]
MDRNRVANALVLLRLGVFVVMLFWTLDKFINPQHSSGIFEKFYGLSGMSANFFMLIGIAQLALVLAFVAGYKKRFTYGAVLILHLVSTLSSWQQYMDPFNNLLFFAAWPMLAACFALYYLRDMDTHWTIDRK